ncbi:synthetase [Paraburkholderia monticola]|uniref:Synthetase n=1 Tax=Paraburkholderia monticola TaxID=1399968 RepID=A0A149PBX7_9BURK|nr:alanyl-tRNA editing protein [Paraburkholderia monticola]KXU82513.1 synthetase [Paraburkholderia monticola]
MRLNRRTTKLFYNDAYLAACETHVVKVDGAWVELADTVAYPEGGGQDSDHGTIAFHDGTVLRFIHAKKMYGHAAGVPGFPDIQVDGVVLHQIHADDQHLLACLVPETHVKVSIDVTRRAALSVSHSASHLLYLAVGLHRPDAVADTLGCHIKIGGTRFDFGVDQRFTAEDLGKIQETANELVRRDLAIHLSAHPDVPDARVWHCDDHVIPCGGTHIERTGLIGEITVRRKSLGIGKERISCEFPHAHIQTDRYHV